MNASVRRHYWLRRSANLRKEEAMYDSHGPPCLSVQSSYLVAYFFASNSIDLGAGAHHYGATS